MNHVTLFMGAAMMFIAALIHREISILSGALVLGTMGWAAWDKWDDEQREKRKGEEWT